MSNPTLPFATPRRDLGLSRRQFVKHFVLGTAASALPGPGWVVPLLADCQPASPSHGVLRLRLADYPSLASTPGSVRISLNPFTQSAPNGNFYPFLINRDGGGQFYAMTSRCTHQGCVVASYNTGTLRSTCPCHGSQFDIQGRVIAGPAGAALPSYATSFDGVVLCVQVPGLGFKINASPLTNTAGMRLRFQFPTFRNASYELRRRLNVADPGVVVPFATSATGLETVNVLNGTGNAATIYVTRSDPVAFYSVSIRIVTS